MPSLTIKSFSTLVQEQAAAIQGRAKRILDFSIGSFLRAIVESNAGVGIWLQSEMLKVLATTRAATSTGADLDSWVEDFGLYRLGAQSARGVVTFSRFTPSVQAVVPVGATVQTVDGTALFIVVADASNSNFNVGMNGYVMGSGVASIDVPVIAQTPGAVGNVLAGTIGFIQTQITYVDTVTNAAAIAGGGEAESDASLRTRFIDYIQSLSRGTLQAIRFGITNLALGLQATILENVNADGTDNSGFLCVTVSTSDPVNPTPSGPVLEAARAAGDAYRAGGMWLGVFPPVLRPVLVELSLVLDPAYEQSTLFAGVTEVVSGHVNGLKLGAPLYWAKLVQLAIGSSPGVLSVSRCAIGGQEETDYVVTKRDIIRLQTLAVS